MENYRFCFQMFLQISRTPDFERSFRVKRCGLYAGVYGNTKKKTLEIECLCLFVFITPADFIFSSSCSHSNNTRDTQEHLLFQQ